MTQPCVSGRNFKTRLLSGLRVFGRNFKTRTTLWAPRLRKEFQNTPSLPLFNQYTILRPLARTAAVRRVSCARRPTGFPYIFAASKDAKLSSEMYVVCNSKLRDVMIVHVQHIAVNSEQQKL
jgi:hypothetical protein